MINLHATLSGLKGLVDEGSQESTSMRLYEDLRRRIISLEFPPGTVFPRNEVAAQYQVSQTPLREAMQRLETDGLVRVYPQHKTVVTKIVTDQVFDGHFLRSGLETEVARQLALNCKSETLSNARAIISMQESIASDPEQLQAFQDLDDLFHLTLYVGVGRRKVFRWVTSRSGHLGRMRRLQRHDDQKIRFILDGHRGIIGAIAAGDESAAVAAMRLHLSQTLTNIDALKGRFPDFFE